MNLKEYSKYALTLLFILIIYLSYVVIKPFIITIAAAMIIAYITTPLYKYFYRRTHQQYLSSATVVILLILLLTLPIVLVLNLLVDQTIDAYQFAKENIPLLQERLFEDGMFQCNSQKGVAIACTIYERTTQLIGKEQVTNSLHESIANVTTVISRTSYQMLRTLPTRILDLGIMIFLVFFFLIDGEKLFNILRLMLPMKLAHENYIIKRLKETTHAVVFGQISTAIIQGILAGIGFAIFGVSNAVLLGILTIFFALIPMVGTAFVWAPVGVYMILKGYVEGNFWSWLGPQHSVLSGILLLAWGMMIVGTIDNFLKPKLIGDRAKLHPVVIFLGVFGGIKIFGVIGILLGPIIFGVFFTFLDILEKENQGIIRKGEKEKRSGSGVNKL